MSTVPLGWASVQLGELGLWSGGGTPSKKVPEYWSGTIPWVSPKDMKTNRIVDAVDHISDEALTRSAANLVPEGSVLVVTRSGILRHSLPVAVTERAVALNQDLKALVPARGVDASYVAWVLRSRAPSILGECSKSGTTVSNVDTDRLLRYRIGLPPLAEQRRIVAAIEEQFSRLDAADESLLRAQRRLVPLRERIIESAFVGDWPWTTLGEIAEVVGGVTKDAKRQTDPSFIEVPYLRVANVQRGFLDLREVTTIRVPPARARTLELRRGDVLFNEGGDRDKLGRGWVWSGEVERCIHQNHVFRARMFKDFEPKFVSLHGNTFGRQWFDQHGRQTTNLASLNLTTLKSFPVPAPPRAEQRRIVAEIEQGLSVMDATRDAIEVAKKRSAALRRSILELAFAGKLVPQDPDDEPASVLLERIRAERAALPAALKRRPARSGH